MRGCITAMDLAVLALSVVKQGEDEVPGLTDKVLPKRLGPKRATKIRKFFGLGKDDDVSAPSRSHCCPAFPFFASSVLRRDWFRRLNELNADRWCEITRFANLSSAAKSNPRAKTRNHIPKHPVSSASSLLNVSSTSATEWHSSVAKPNPPRMLP